MSPLENLGHHIIEFVDAVLESSVSPASSIVGWDENSFGTQDLSLLIFNILINQYVQHCVLLVLYALCNRTASKNVSLKGSNDTDPITVFNAHIYMHSIIAVSKFLC